MGRKIPCQYCKQRRRKCERNCESEPCARCIRMKRKCVPQEITFSDDSSIEEDEEIANEKYANLCQQVEELQIEMHSLEKSLIKQKNAIVMIKPEPVWKIVFENGQLVLESDIKSFQDFDLYGRSLIRYLSPFGSTFQTTSLVFEKTSSGIIHRAVKTVSQLADYNYQEKGNEYTDSYIIKCIDPSIFVDKLIGIYFHCFNNLVPMLHEESYKKHLKTLDNKLDDPITLAICATSSIHTCPHAFFKSHEKRYFGEYFYKKCMDKLIDMFDEPGKELESLIIANTLQTFMFTTLRMRECKKWATIGSVLTSSLKEKYPNSARGEVEKDESTRIMYAVIHRNSIFARSIFSLINFLGDHRPECFDGFNEPLDILPDEPELVKEMIRLINHVIKIESNPITSSIYSQSRLSKSGQEMKLTFEDIVRYEEVVMEWWKDLPDELKLCKDPYKYTKELISQCSDSRQLLVSLYIHGLTMNIQSNFFNPKETSEVHEVLREKAVYLATYAAEMVLATVKRCEKLGTFCFSPAKLLIRSMDVLVTLTQIRNSEINDKMKARIEEFMQEFKKSISPDHQVSIHAPFFSSLLPTASEVPIRELYKHYPLPSEAMLFDVVHSSVIHITEM